MRRISALSSLFPYTTLFRSVEGDDVALTAVGAAHEVVRAAADEYSVPAVAQCRDAVRGRSDEVALDRVGIRGAKPTADVDRSEEHTSELQSRGHLVCRLLFE